MLLRQMSIWWHLLCPSTQGGDPNQSVPQVRVSNRAGGKLSHAVSVTWHLTLHLPPSPPPFPSPLSPPQARHTQVRVLGDRTAQFKLLSRNVLFLATASHPPPGGASGATAGSPPVADEAWLAVHLVDAVSGHVIDRVVHRGACGPVHAVRGAMV